MESAERDSTPFLKGILVRRYKRFLAEVKLGGERTVVAHCPNTGSMLGCCEPGMPVWLSVSGNTARKTTYTWEFIEMPTSLVGVNTHLANRLVKDAVNRREIEAFLGYERIQSEIKTGSHSRLDLKLSGGGLPDCYVEVKNCTFVENGVAMFPDAATLRGQRHLVELSRLAALGKRAVLFIVVQRMDARIFTPADGIDPTYGRLLREALSGGAELIVYDTLVKPFHVTLRSPVKTEL